MEITIKQHGKWYVDFWVNGKPYRLNKFGIICQREAGKWAPVFMGEMQVPITEAVIKKTDGRAIYIGRKIAFQFKH